MSSENSNKPVSKPRRALTTKPLKVYEEADIEEADEDEDKGLLLQEGEYDEDLIRRQREQFQAKEEAIENTNQSPLVPQEYFVTEEAARNSQLLANHEIRISIMENFFMQSHEGVRDQLLDLRQEMTEQMEVLDGARVNRATAQAVQKRAVQASAKARSRNANNSTDG